MSHAVGVALKLNDGTGPYAFNCGAPAFRFTEDRLINDIGPRLVAMVRNIEAGARRRSPAIQKSRKQKTKSRRESCTFGRGDQIAFTMTGEIIRTVILAPSIRAGETR